MGRNGIPGLNPSRVFLLDFCASCNILITNTMFEHQCTWHEDALGWILMISEHSGKESG